MLAHSQPLVSLVTGEPARGKFPLEMVAFFPLSNEDSCRVLPAVGYMYGGMSLQEDPLFWTCKIPFPVNY